jgi:hypothetical protein
MASDNNDGTKPQAMAIPDGAISNTNREHYEPVFPRTPARHGFMIIAKVNFMYQGIFDTDFDKYTDDAVALFTKTGLGPH